MHIDTAREGAKTGGGKETTQAEPVGLKMGAIPHTGGIELHIATEASATLRSGEHGIVARAVYPHPGFERHAGRQRHATRYDSQLLAGGGRHVYLGSQAVHIGKIAHKSVGSEFEEGGQAQAHIREMGLLHIAAQRGIHHQGFVGPAAIQIGYGTGSQTNQVVLAHTSMQRGAEFAGADGVEGIHIHIQLRLQFRGCSPEMQVGDVHRHRIHREGGRTVGQREAATLLKPERGDTGGKA